MPQEEDQLKVQETFIVKESPLKNSHLKQRRSKRSTVGNNKSDFEEQHFALKSYEEDFEDENLETEMEPMFESNFLDSTAFKSIVQDVMQQSQRLNKKKPKATISVEELEQAFNMNFCKKTEAIMSNFYNEFSGERKVDED